jgi:protein involved in ribonucleotide reduction
MPEILRRFSRIRALSGGVAVSGNSTFGVLFIFASGFISRRGNHG